MRAFENAAVRQHDADGPHCAAEWSIRHRPTVRIHAERAPNAEIVVDCMTAGEYPALSKVAITSRQVAPAEARKRHGARIDLAGALGEGDRCAIARNALTTHGVPCDSRCERTPSRRRGFQFRAQSRDHFRFRVHGYCQMNSDWCRIEAARIIDNDALLCVPSDRVAEAAITLPAPFRIACRDSLTSRESVCIATTHYKLSPVTSF